MKNVASVTRAISKRKTDYLKRRPHRTLRLTRRRDYKRSMELPGYWSFTIYAWKLLWKNRKTFLLLGLIYAILTGLMVGIASQDIYSTFASTLDDVAEETIGVLGEFSRAGALFFTAATGGFSQTLTDVQQVYAVITGMLVWLTTIWLLRNILAGHKIKLRDGLYNAGAPILSTFLIVLVLLVQLIPLAIAFIGYAAASATGLLTGGVEAMLFWIVAVLLGALSAYWVTSTLFALVIVTLPGMYPMKALKTAGDMVVGRRLRILLRLLWMGVMLAVVWMVVIMPVIMLDSWLKNMWPVIDWLPIVPVTLLVMSTITVIWSSSYIYLLYRKVVADETKPA